MTALAGIGVVENPYPVFALARAVSAWLQENGIRKGDRICRLSPTSLDSVLLFYGAACLPFKNPANVAGHITSQRRAAMSEGMVVELRMRLSAADAHYGGNLVDGAYVLAMFGDVATELIEAEQERLVAHAARMGELLLELTAPSGRPWERQASSAIRSCSRRTARGQWQMWSAGLCAL